MYIGVFHDNNVFDRAIRVVSAHSIIKFNAILKCGSSHSIYSMVIGFHNIGIDNFILINTKSEAIKKNGKKKRTVCTTAR